MKLQLRQLFCRCRIRLQQLLHRRRFGSVDPCGQGQLAVQAQPEQDCGDLFGGFVLAPDRFHHPDPLAPLQIEARLLVHAAGCSSPSNTSGNGLPCWVPVVSRASCSKRSCTASTSSSGIAFH